MSVVVVRERLIDKLANCFDRLDYWRGHVDSPGSYGVRAGELVEEISSSIEGVGREYLLSGSGFDAGVTVSLDQSSRERIVLLASYHHMDQEGYYCGWSSFKVIVLPAFLLPGFRVEISMISKSPEVSWMDIQCDWLEYWAECFMENLSDTI